MLSVILPLLFIMLALYLFVWIHRHRVFFKLKSMMMWVIFFENIDMSKVDSNFALKVQNMFSTKSLFKQCVQVIDFRDNFQYVIVKSNNEVMILQCAIENCKWSLHASCCIHGDRTL